MSLSEQPLSLAAVGQLKHPPTVMGLTTSGPSLRSLWKLSWWQLWVLLCSDFHLRRTCLPSSRTINSLILKPEKTCPWEPVQQAQGLLPAASSRDVRVFSAFSVSKSCMSKTQDAAVMSISAEVHPFWCCQSASCGMKTVLTQLHSVMDSYFLINDFEAFWNNVAQRSLILKPKQHEKWHAEAGVRISGMPELVLTSLPVTVLLSWKKLQSLQHRGRLWWKQAATQIIGAGTQVSQKLSHLAKATSQFEI